MAFRAPLLGYNTNVRHAGKLYHIQTEDSGVDHPHVITHLFADGGRILASKKTSYADRVGGENLQDAVKKLMQAQHKAMFIALRDGVYDEDQAEDGEDQTGPRKLPPALQEAIAAETRAAHDPPSEPNLPIMTAVAARPASATFKAPKLDVQRDPPSESVSLDPKDTVVTKAPATARSLFGADLVSDKGLDEVILNYLAANEKEG